ncbi:MAG TPA: hypothetical protein VMH37_20015 [Candidatus Binataceae bacterium]|nr:hypothetical protein [Candidatus Binataceae bacterium]
MLRALKLGSSPEFLDGMLRRKIAAALATSSGISVSADELEDALVAFYTDRDLFESPQIEAWLKALRLDENAVRDHVAELLLGQRARDSLVTDEAVHDRFASERYEYDRATFELFEFSSQGEAHEFILAVREHERRAQDGQRRDLARREVAEEVRAALFSGETGDLFGPVENDAGKYEVYLLRQRREARLDEDLANEIRDEMFDELLDAEFTKHPLAFLR